MKKTLDEALVEIVNTPLLEGGLIICPVLG
jgi:hypothetical protein